MRAFHPVLACFGRRLQAFVAVVCLGIAGLSSVFGQELETERWRAPMRVDRSDVATDLIIEFSFERIEAPLLNYQPTAAEPDSLAMTRFALSLVSGNLEQALDMTAVAPGGSREDNRELLVAFGELLGSVPESIRLDRVVHMGQDRLMLWSLPLENGQRFYRSFRFVRDPASNSLVYEGLATEPASSLLTYAFQVQQAAGADARPASAFDYDYIVPGTESQPVRFRFDGNELDVNAFNPLGQTGHAAVDFFNRSMSVLANGTAAEYASLFTEFSRERYASWAVDQGTDGYEAYREEMLDYGARVVFHLDADPLYLVFYVLNDPSVKGSPLRYAAVYKDPKDGLRLTNFYVHGLVDTVLQRRDYFEDPFLRPLLAASGIILDEAGAIGVVASGDEVEPPNPDEMAAVFEPLLAIMEEEKAALSQKSGASSAKGPLWPWILGALVLIAISATVLLRQRN